MAIFKPESWQIIWPKLAIQTGQNMAITLLHLHSFSCQILYAFSSLQTENMSFFWSFSVQCLFLPEKDPEERVFRKWRFSLLIHTSSASSSLTR